MSNDHKSPGQMRFMESNVDRRGKERVYTPFQATVRGLDANGTSFYSKTVVDNLSASGLYLRLTHCPKPGAKLFVSVQFANAQVNDLPAGRLEIRGEVLRVEPKPGGVCGLAIVIERNRFV